MASIEKQVKKDNASIGKGKQNRRDDIEDADDQDTFIEAWEKRKLEEEEEEVEYDEHGYPIRKNKKASLLDVMPAPNHDEIKYIHINKNFYAEHEDIAKLSPAHLHGLARKLNVKATGFDVPKPIASFAHFGFDEAIMAEIQRLGYATPTPIQAQSVPAGLSGRDVIGIAKTGSGKTAAYIWPMISHIMDQPELAEGEGPIGLVVVPTKELVLQIVKEAKRFAKPYNIGVGAAYGGGNKYEQLKAIGEGCEIVIAVPGRLIDYIKEKKLDMKRASYLVLDEADHMFSKGFEPQLRSVINQVRPDRQTLLFSATFPKRIERLARDILCDPVRVVVGEIGEANKDVTQTVLVIGPGQSKWNWLTSRLVEFCSAGSVLIFVTQKVNSELLSENLKTNGYPEVLLLHGDLHQSTRQTVINDFKKGKSKILVATDVAARGLDIPAVRTVVNFDIARDIDTHTHRIGRTGRAGTKGTAYTLVANQGPEKKEAHFAGELVRSLEQASQVVPKELLDLANEDPTFTQRRYRRSDGGGGGGGKGGGKKGAWKARSRAGIGAAGFKHAPTSSEAAAQASGGATNFSMKFASKLGKPSPAGKSWLDAPRNAGGGASKYGGFAAASSGAAQGMAPPPGPPPGSTASGAGGDASGAGTARKKSRWG